MSKRVLILGGGFGGVYTALGLEKTLARKGDIEVTLINRENSTLFTPMLHEVAASDVDFSHIVNPIRRMLKHVQFVQGDIQSIDLERKHVVVMHGPENHHHELSYDYLVIALGSTTNFFGLPGVSERALTMKSLSDATHLRNRLIDLLEGADAESGLEMSADLLTVVVAGGGFAGTETVAGLNDFLRESIRYFPHLREELIRVVLIHPGDVILPELGRDLGTYAQKKLAERKIEIRTGTRVTAVDEEGVDLSDGTRIPARTIIWTAGTAPNPILSKLPCKMDHGRIVANEFLEVPGYDGVWALGDCASIVEPKTGHPYPPTAQHALRQAKVAARNIYASVRGGKRSPFVFSTLGLLAAIGRRAGVAQILGIHISGFPAWFLWRTIYLMKLPRIEKKIRVALDWTLDLVFSKDLVHFLDLRPPVDMDVPEERHDLAATTH
ncbi:MAG: NAD(P)/FAD-dependent oxidoreductase [Bryobacteraceae bacterium]